MGWVVNATSLGYPLYGRMGGPQDRSGRVWKNLTPTRIQSPDCPARSQSLYQLSYPDPTSLLQECKCIVIFKFPSKDKSMGSITICPRIYNTLYKIAFRIKALFKKLIVFTNPKLHSIHSLRTHRQRTLLLRHLNPFHFGLCYRYYLLSAPRNPVLSIFFSFLDSNCVWVYHLRLITYAIPIPPNI
jgi:hypothetical protein